MKCVEEERSVYDVEFITHHSAVIQTICPSPGFPAYRASPLIGQKSIPIKEINNQQPHKTHPGLIYPHQEIYRGILQ